MHPNEEEPPKPRGLLGGVSVSVVGGPGAAAAACPSAPGGANSACPLPPASEVSAETQGPLNFVGFVF